MISSGSISRVLAFRSYLTQTRIVAVPLSGCSGEPCPSSLALIARRWSVGIASHGQTTGCIRIGYRTTDLSIVRCKTCSIGPARSCTVSARNEAGDNTVRAEAGCAWACQLANSLRACSDLLVWVVRLDATSSVNASICRRSSGSDAARSRPVTWTRMAPSPTETVISRGSISVCGAS